jgi:hypothetical protein
MRGLDQRNHFTLGTQMELSVPGNTPVRWRLGVVRKVATRHGLDAIALG